MMRFRVFSLPFALVALLGSCRDLASPEPVTAARVPVGKGSRVIDEPFFPGAAILAVNSAGGFFATDGEVSARFLPGGDFEPFGAPFPLSAPQFDERGVLFAILSFEGQGIGVMWLLDGNILPLDPAEGENVVSLRGRSFDDGSVVAAIKTFNAAAPVGEKRKLYRFSWSGVAEEDPINQLIAQSEYQYPGIHGITDDGSVVWSILDEDSKNQLYRSAPDLSTLHYAVALGHIEGSQLAGNLATGNDTYAADGYGRVVGTSLLNGFGYVPVLWIADGSVVTLPFGPAEAGDPGQNAAQQIVGDYIVGTLLVGDYTRPARWHWNGSSWDLGTYQQREQDVSTVAMNSNGVLAATYLGGTPGILFGVPTAADFFSTESLESYNFAFVDGTSKIWYSGGTLTATPVLTAPANMTVPAGVRFKLPVGFIHPLGSDDAPFTYKVRWNSENSTTTYSTADILFDQAPDFRHIYADAGTYVARVIVSDQAGLADTTLTTIVVLPPEAAPTASVPAPPTNVPEGEDLVIDASASSDPNALPLTFKWQLDGLGAGQEAVMRRRNVPQGLHFWRVIVTNSAGLADTAVGEVTVNNVAPTGRLIIPKAAVSQLSPFQLSVANIQDAPADVSAGIAFSFNCGAGYTEAGPSSSFNCDGVLNPGTNTVGVKLIDQWNAEREYTATITVKNKPPLVTFVSFEAHPTRSGRYRATYTILDGPGDAPFVGTFFVNGVRTGGSVVSGPSANSVYFDLTPGDLVTVRVKDQSGAVTSVTAEFTGG